MANQEQLEILKQGVEVWNEWRANYRYEAINLTEANLGGANLNAAYFRRANLVETNLSEASLIGTNFFQSNLYKADLRGANLNGANLSQANLLAADFNSAILDDANFTFAVIGFTRITKVDLSKSIGLEEVKHQAPSQVSRDTLVLSRGRISGSFLRGCGFGDWEIAGAKLYNPDLSNAAIRKIQDNMYDLRATQAVQISPLFISYSHADGMFIDKLETQLNKKGIRFWRDIHEMKAGRIETQIDQAIRLNPTVLVVLSENSTKSDWVEHEVRTARELEKKLGRDTLCPVALDDSWKDSPWPKRVMEQVMEYNILDFSEWEDDVKFEGMFRRLIDGLELFYKG